MICSHNECKNDNKDVSRWELTDSRGYSCGVVCNDCHDKQKRTTTLSVDCPYII